MEAQSGQKITEMGRGRLLPFLFLWCNIAKVISNAILVYAKHVKAQ